MIDKVEPKFLSYDEAASFQHKVTKDELVLRTFLVISVGDFTTEQIVENRGITQLPRKELPETIRPYLKNKGITVQVDGHNEDDEGNVHPSSITELHLEDIHSKHLLETRLISKYVMTTQVRKTSEDADKFVVRLPDGVRKRIAEEAEKNKRSSNQEFLVLLDEALSMREGKNSVGWIPKLGELVMDRRGLVFVIEEFFIDENGVITVDVHNSYIGNTVAKLEDLKPYIFK